MTEASTCKHLAGERRSALAGRPSAGIHLIVDLIGATRIDDVEHIEATLHHCVAAAKATLLHLHVHRFSDGGGVSGVAVLAESHITIHTWPERGYAAFDVFMCGEADPHRVLGVLRAAFAPTETRVHEHLRGTGV
jgi:S-adenosylmethionine decarboxylase